MTAQRLKAEIPRLVCVMLLSLATASSAIAEGLRTNVGEQIRQQCAERSTSGGVLVYFGNPDDALLADVAEMFRGRFLVEGLLSEEGDLAGRRERLLADGIYGKVSLAAWSGPDLPFIPNLVNVLVIDPPGKASRDEIERVLAPCGFALIGQGDDWKVIEKEPPKESDKWTHYLHDADNNAVSQDPRIDSISHLQWVGGPQWSRHHDHVASLTALVSDGRRIFYVFDEGKTSSILLPAKHVLIARDAFNGAVLWKTPLRSWFPHLWPFKSGPAQLPRRLVAENGKVYLPLGMAEPLSVLDAATGKTLRTFPETDAVEEVLVFDGKIFVLANPKPEMFKSLTLGNGLNSDQKAWAGRSWPWDEKKRNLMVFDDASGKRLWKKEAVVAPLTLAASAKGLVFYDGQCIVALDTSTGKELWRSAAVSAKHALEIYESPILVLYKNYVLFAGANGRMTALDAGTGETLWEAEHLSGGHFSPKDLIVVDDLVWSANIASPRQRDSGVFVGMDLATGEVMRTIPPTPIDYTFGHHRCYRVKATCRYILASKTGIEFYDTKERTERINDWVRGGCLYGIMPTNGLIYSPMHSCACFLDSKLTGFNALAPKRQDDDTPTSPAPKRLEKGPAYSKTRTSKAEIPDAESWATYRADNARSAYAPLQVADNVKVKWEGKLPGKPSALTVVGGKVFAAAVDQHCLVALDEMTGDVCWSFFAGGRVDSPPTLYKGFVYFGSADGHVYCLDAADGKLAWRFRLAPRERQLFSRGQLESVWPVSGSVLMRGGKLFCVGGRSAFLDGGLPFVRLDALSGQLEAETWINDVDPQSGKSIQMLADQSQMPSALPDILSSDGTSLFMRVQKLSEDGERLGTFKRGDDDNPAENRHIFSWGGFLDGSWLHRVYMSYASGRTRMGTNLEWFTYGETNPDGRLLVMDSQTVYGYGLKPKFHTWSSTFQDFQVFSVNKKIETDKITGPTIFGKPYGRAPNEQLRFNWTLDIPIYVRSMIKAGDKLFLCGPEDVVDEVDATKRYPAKDVLETLKHQDAILDGADGCQFWVVRAADGTVLQKLHLPGLPAWDGMAASKGRIYLPCTDGKILCLE